MKTDCRGEARYLLPIDDQRPLPMCAACFQRVWKAVDKRGGATFYSPGRVGTPCQGPTLIEALAA